jgi:hypothetical protein
VVDLQVGILDKENKWQKRKRKRKRVVQRHIHLLRKKENKWLERKKQVAMVIVY